MAVILPLPTLAPGDYKAPWMSVGRDGHHVHGELSFTVKMQGHGMSAIKDMAMGDHDMQSALGPYSMTREGFLLAAGRDTDDGQAYGRGRLGPHGARFRQRHLGVIVFLLPIDTVALRNASHDNDLRGRPFGAMGNPPRRGVPRPLRVNLSERYDYPTNWVKWTTVGARIHPVATGRNWSDRSLFGPA